MTRKTKISICVFVGLILAGGVAWIIDFPGFADPAPREISAVLGSNPGAKCYVYPLGGFIDREYLWRLDAKPETIATVIAGLDLEESPTIPRSFWRMPPYYWPRLYRTDMKAYRSSGFRDDSRGSDGDHYFLLHDPKAHRAYVWFRNNF